MGMSRPTRCPPPRQRHKQPGSKASVPVIAIWPVHVTWLVVSSVPMTVIMLAARAMHMACVMRFHRDGQRLARGRRSVLVMGVRMLVPMIVIVAMVVPVR